MKNFIVIIFIVSTNLIYSQGFNEFFNAKAKQDSSLLSLSVENTNFVFNSEYFNNFNVGHTLLGYFIKPEVTYKPFEKVNFSGGVFIQSYFGEKSLTKFRPVFSINYKASKHTNIIFGDISGTINHNLPEPVFNTELYLTENIENGLQILYKGTRLKTDFWVNWEQFIFPDSSFPEIFTAGLSNVLRLTRIESKHDFSLKFSGIATHTGGQIEHRGVPVQTLANTVSGFDYNINFQTLFLKKIHLFSYYLTSFDASPEKNLPYLYGFGVLSGIGFSNSVLDIELQHWYGDYYFSKKGNPVFQSVSQMYNGFKENQRAMFLTKTFFSKKINKFFKIGVGADTYYDLYNLSLDFTFGFYIKTNFDFLLKK